MTRRKKQAKTLCEVFANEARANGEPWPRPLEAAPHKGGRFCDCPECRAKPLPEGVPCLAAPRLPEGIPMPDPRSPSWPMVFAFACALEATMELERLNRLPGGPGDDRLARKARLEREAEDIAGVVVDLCQEAPLEATMEVLLEMGEAAASIALSLPRGCRSHLPRGA